MTGFVHDLPFGAQLQPDGRVRFRLWAPSQERVSLVVDQQQPLPLEPLEQSGCAQVVPALGERAVDLPQDQAVAAVDEAAGITE